jgi:hypothetical protein
MLKINVFEIETKALTSQFMINCTATVHSAVSFGGCSGYGVRASNQLLYLTRALLTISALTSAAVRDFAV